MPPLIRPEDAANMDIGKAWIFLAVVGVILIITTVVLIIINWRK